MLDKKGRLIRLGDRVCFGGPIHNGVVVFSLDTDEFAPSFPKDGWSYLGTGIMIQMDNGALVFLDVPDEHTEVVV